MRKLIFNSIHQLFNLNKYPMKKIILFIVLVFAGTVFSQKKNAAINEVQTLSCKCSDLVLYSFFYYQDPQNAPNSSLLLRFDFQHKGKMKCKPEFTGNITIYKDINTTVTIPLSSLTSLVDTDGQRVFVITQLNLPDSFRPMRLNGVYKISYSMSYGTGVCPAKSSKNVRFMKSEPIL